MPERKGWGERAREGWERGRRTGGYGSQFDGWQSGVASSDDRHGPETSHAGRGPKGYRRADERIHEDVCERLTEDGALDARDITVTVDDGEVTLTGSVASRGQKRRADDLAAGVAGVRDVMNQIRVAGER